MRSESETISDSSFTVHVGLKTAEFTNEHTEEGFLLLNILICREKGLSVFSLSFNTHTHTHTSTGMSRLCVVDMVTVWLPPVAG